MWLWTLTHSSRTQRLETVIKNMSISLAVSSEADRSTQRLTLGHWTDQFISWEVMIDAFLYFLNKYRQTICWTESEVKGQVLLHLSFIRCTCWGTYASEIILSIYGNERLRTYCNLQLLDPAWVQNSRENIRSLFHPWSDKYTSLLFSRFPCSSLFRAVEFYLRHGRYLKPSFVFTTFWNSLKLLTPKRYDILRRTSCRQ